jgi:hypothetical protein
VVASFGVSLTSCIIAIFGLSGQRRSCFSRSHVESQATTPIPVQLSGPEFIAFIFPHLSMPTRGPKCKLGYHRVFNLILWVLYTGMQWKLLPVPEPATGPP